MASRSENTYAFVKLGDYYYYGKHSSGQDYQQAYFMYRRATYTNSSADFKAQAYLSLGYMKQFGIGTDIEFKAAKDYYQ